MHKLILTLILFLFAFIQANAENNNTNSISVHNPWIRWAPANAPVLGVFMQIDNNTASDVRLIGVNVIGYQRAEIHRTINDDGLMKMVRQDFAPIAAGRELKLQPGGWHIMLIKPEQVPSAGDEVPMVLHFDDGSEQTVRVPVKD
ncbi:MAG: copper chaperone PCu(A)C, partial [Candidatus Thioglobus sp.]